MPEGSDMNLSIWCCAFGLFPEGRFQSVRLNGRGTLTPVAHADLQLVARAHATSMSEFSQFDCGCNLCLRPSHRPLYEQPVWRERRVFTFGRTAAAEWQNAVGEPYAVG